MKYAGFSALLFVLFLSPAFKPQAPSVTALDSSIFFEENLGQFAQPIRYQVTLGDRQVRWMDDGVSIALIREVTTGRSTLDQTPLEVSRFPDNVARKTRLEEKTFEAMVYGLEFEGMASTAQLVGREAQAFSVNYFRGNDPSQWVQGVTRYAELWYEGLYPGIDLRYFGLTDEVLKYDFVVAPQADPGLIQVRVSGSESLSILPDGRLAIHTPWGDVYEDAPICYQMVDGFKVDVSMAYTLLNAKTFGFVFTGNYDPNRELIIDPVTMNWATFLHTSTSDDYVMAGTRDASGYLYMVGYTQSATFPVTPGVFQDVYAGGIDNWVAKMNPTGTNLEYLTFLGGTGWELPYGIGISASGHAVIAGFCSSTDYPITAGSLQDTYPGGLVKGFVTRLNPFGTNLVYSTFLGGSNIDYPYDLYVASDGSAYVTGFTMSTDYPTTSGAFDTQSSSGGDLFLSKILPDGSAFAYSTLFGGNGHDIGNGIMVNDQGEAVVVGNTGSNNLPFSNSAYQSSANFTQGYTQEDGFVARFSADGSLLLGGTYLGGSASDVMRSVDIGPNGDIYVAGVTYSTNFPTTPGAFQPAAFANTSSFGDVFAARFSPEGDNLVYSTYLGGTNVDFCEAIRVNDNDEAHILGSTMSPDFYTTGESNSFVAMYDVFLTVLDATGGNVPYSILYGGSYNDYPRASGSLFVDQHKVMLYVTSHSPDAPVTAGSYQSVKANGINDAPWIMNMEFNTVLTPTVANFTATWDETEAAARLSWSVAETEGIAGWRIERQQGQEAWTEVTRLDGNAPTSFLDHEVPAGRWNYRVAVEGPDGSLAWSPALGISVPVSGSVGSLVEVFPNPARDRITVRYYQQPDEYVRLVLRDAWGKEILTLLGLPPLSQAGWRTQKITLPRLERGIYFLSVYRTETPLAVRKVVVQ
ncbi:MAG: hypothetical protein D6722_07865 [Bacteroidetes bacterium]|nr:MAG: hypothetical protein D6722_07865 [Bacteroidota bacterium]